MNTFNSIEGSRQLQVKPLHECFTLVIEYKDAGRSGLTIAQSDAPAVALAILEAAGYDASQGRVSNIGHAMHWLKLEISLAETKAAEAKEQAELEAEALDFLNVSREAKHLGPLGNFDEHTKDAWLAVARKAREMRAEK